MPIEIFSASRRRFLAASVAASAACVCETFAAETKHIDTNRFALLADTHIPSKPETESRGTNMTANLRSVVKQLLALAQPAAAAIILGDCAHLNGRPDDYTRLREELAPLSAADWPVHLALGNHDHREHCLAAFPGSEGHLFAQVERRVAVIESPHANWFLLDSLDIVDKTPGKLGEQQLQWLAAALDKHAAKPALIGLHHNPMSDLLKVASPSNGNVKGLIDTDAFFKVIDPRRQVKAVFFGHTHVWSVVEHAGIHLVNLPPVAYTFDKTKPNGWVDCQVAGDRAKLTMYCHNETQPEHKSSLELSWRKA